MDINITLIGQMITFIIFVGLYYEVCLGLRLKKQWMNDEAKLLMD